MNKQVVIYKITSPSGKIYIGQTVNYIIRVKRYKRLECEKQYKIYNSFLKYGVENHTFEIIEECEVDDLNCRERYWQDFYEVCDKEKGLNLLLTECGAKRREITEEYRERMSEIQKKIAKRGKEAPFYGRKHSEESKKKMSESRSGENNYQYGKSSHMKGKKHSAETLRIMSSKQRGKNNPKAKVIIDLETGIYYEYAGEVADLYGIKITTLRGKLNGSRKNNTNFRYC